MSVRDNVIELRKIRHADTLVERIIHGAAAEIERLREEAERFRAERDEARLQMGRILNEIDCRIEHGAESNGHLEAIYNLFKENTND